MMAGPPKTYREATAKRLPVCLGLLSQRDMMKVSSNNLRNLLIVSVITVQFLITGFSAIPVTGAVAVKYDTLVDPLTYNTESNGTVEKETGQDQKAALQKFVSSVEDGESETVRGIFVEDGFEYPVVQQPPNQPAFVSTQEDVVTEFAMADKYGSIGILAHNFLAGEAFFSLKTNDVIQVVYGDGTVDSYQVTEVMEYQALSPKSASSSFKDVDSGETLTSTQLFKKVYTGKRHLTLQTCIQVGSEDSWGRLFVIAEPLV